MTSRRESSSWIVRFARAHARLWMSLGLAGVSFGLLSFIAADSTVVMRLLVSWDIGALFYLGAAALMMARSPVAHIRRHSAAQDEGAYVMLLLTVGAAVASLGAIFVELAAADRSQQGYAGHIVLAVVTIVLSWTFLHTIYALHYAYEYYGEGRRSEGLKFPGDKEPDYWDFVYFAFVIGMTFQVSDVAVTNKWIRRTVVTHGAISFLFSTTIVALTVNMAAGLLGSGR